MLRIGSIINISPEMGLLFYNKVKSRKKERNPIVDILVPIENAFIRIPKTFIDYLIYLIFGGSLLSEKVSTIVNLLTSDSLKIF